MSDVLPMTKYLDAKICDIRDLEFQAMVTGLCHCSGLSQSEFVNDSFRFMVMAIVKEDAKCLSEKYLPVPGILTRKVDSLSPDSIVHHVCRELVEWNRSGIESFDGKKVLSLIRKCSKVCCPKLPRQKKLTRNQLRYRSQTDLILLRRRNGSL